MTASRFDSRKGVNIRAGASTALSGTVMLSNASNISFGMFESNGSLVVTAGVNLGLTLSGGTTRITSGTAVFSNSSPFTWGLDGSTLTAALPFVSYWDNKQWNGTGQPVQPELMAVSSGAIQFQRISFQFPMRVTHAALIGVVSSNRTGAGSYTLELGMYTISGAHAGLVSQNSTLYTYGSATTANNSTILGGHTGIRWRTCPVSWNITPGEYILAIRQRGTHEPVLLGNGVIVNVRSAGGVNLDYVNGGIYTASSSVLPANVHVGQILQSGTGQIGVAYVQLAGT